MRDCGLWAAKETLPLKRRIDDELLLVDDTHGIQIGFLIQAYMIFFYRWSRCHVCGSGSVIQI